MHQRLSELEIDRGYVDLSLIVRPDMRRFQALDLLLEFKYLGLKDLGLTGEQARGKTRDELLAALLVVAAKLDEAEDQARRYGAALRERYSLIPFTDRFYLFQIKNDPVRHTRESGYPVVQRLPGFPCSPRSRGRE